MIAQLTGIIREKSPPYLLLEVNSIGYELQAPMSTFYQLPEINNTVSLYTHLAIREDAHQLYGFYQKRDRDLFRALIKINGVGPKLALSILSGIEPNQFIEAIHQQDTSRLVKIPGIGKKTAERLMIECKGALKLEPSTTPTPAFAANTTYDDTIEALTSLGYKTPEAKKAVDKVFKSELKLEELIKSALAQMV